MEEGGFLMQDTALEGQASGCPGTRGAKEEVCSVALPICVPRNCT